MLHGCIDSAKMVVARPVRFLIAVSAGLVLFLFYKLLNPAPPLHVPVEGWNGEKIETMDRDPLLDRMSSQAHKRLQDLTMYSHRRASRATMALDRPRLFPEQ